MRLGFWQSLLAFFRPAARPAPQAPRRAFAQQEAAPAEQQQPSSLAAARVFTPTQPKPGARQLTGRQAELRRILQALIDEHAHVVLYSERGRGKTSLANAVVEGLRRADVAVGRYTCDASSDFDSILRGIARSLPMAFLAGHPPADSQGCEAALPQRPVRPEDVVDLPGKLNCGMLVAVIDEFDRVLDAATRTRLADTIKQLSDRDVPLRFLVMGVAENLDQIIGQHPSIQRSVLGVHLPLFTDRDVAQLLSKATQESGFIFPPDALARVTILARGMPYMAQLLGLRLTQAALARSSATISSADFDTGVAQMLIEANPRTAALYDKLTDRGRATEMVRSLRRLATAPQDAWGRMEQARLLDGGVTVGGRRLSAACWERLLETGVLATIGDDEATVIFAERPLMHHVLLLAANDIADSEPAERQPVPLRPLASQA